MTNTKTLMLAAVTALTLGVGTAMAQAQVPQQQAAPKTTNLWGRIGAGASDIEHGPRGHVLPFDGGYTTLANPG
jgi:hypothetical protein